MAGALIYLSMGYPKKMGECDKDGNDKRKLCLCNWINIT